MKKLASMPSREQMLAELGAGLQSPMAAFVGALNGLLYMMVGALEALKTQTRRRVRVNPRRLRLIANNAPGYAWVSPEERHYNG